MKGFLKAVNLLPAAALAAGSIFAFGQAAQASAEQQGTTLILQADDFSGQSDDTFDIFVTPNGEVTVFGVPGADGATFDNVETIVVGTGIFGNDTVNMTIESSDIVVDIDTNSGGDTVSIDLTVPAGAPATPRFTVNTGSTRANVESFTDDLTLSLVIPQGESSGLEIQQSFGTATLNLAGVIGEIKAGGGADYAVNGMLTDNIFRASTIKVEVEGNLTSDMTIDANDIEVIAKGDLNGSPQLLNAEGIKLEVEGNATGSALLAGFAFSSNLEFLVKGDLDGSPLVRGRSFPDSLKLQIEGSIIAGSPTIDGGGILADSCDGSSGVALVRC